MGALLASIGPFFEVVWARTEDFPSSPWFSVADFVSDRARLAARVLQVRTALAATSDSEPSAIDERVAVSTMQFALVARIVAVAIGIAATDGSGIDLDPQRVWWRDRPGGPVALAARAVPTPFDGRLDATAVEALTATAAAEFAVAPRVLWGNVGSAANSAAALIAAARPDAARRAYDLAAAVLADPRVDDGGLQPGPQFRRRSCCLVYRALGGAAAMCGDCVLVAAR